MWEAVAIVILAGVLISWFMVRRKGQVAFWNQALRNPDVTYDYFKSNDVWYVFDDGLPVNFREYVPASEWIGPFQMYIPKLDNRKIFVFGKKGEFRRSQQELLIMLQSSGQTVSSRNSG